MSQSAALEAVLPDPDQPPESLSPAKLREIAEALADQPGASPALKKHLGQWGRPVSPPAPFDLGKLDAMRQLHLKSAMAPPVADPTHRMLRIFATDPAAATQMETLPIYRATLGVRWEELEPGPVGEYLEIVDVDPASACCYAPVDLDHRHILVTEGLTPSESNPQFHQQMVYAVAMKTIECFELALGRTALWSSRLVGSPVREEYVQRLRVYPHALRQANAYYSPDKKALLFGYFKATGGDPGTNLPGGMVFGCLSHDIIAHETTHALLDGLHRRYIEATNPDTLAFHEAFADIVALFQHFSIPEALRHQIARTRGDLGQDNLLAELAVQFGQATGRYGALRNAIGGIDRETKQWQPRPPSKSDLANATEPHDRGAVLVAAVFDAFLKIYRARTGDLLRLATGGSGVLPPGAIPEPLVDRLAREASKLAAQVLTICIRALDYCPPVDLTFGDYLRALITADRDVVPDDMRTYRVAFISAFRDRGIYPLGVRTLSTDALAWEPPPLPFKTLADVVADLALDWSLNGSREHAWETCRDNAKKFHGWLMSAAVNRDEIAVLGLERLRKGRKPMTLDGVAGTLGNFEVHSVRPTRRVGLDGQARADLVVEITQTWRAVKGPQKLRGGCTLLIDLKKNEVRYLIRKRISEARLKTLQAFAAAPGGSLRDAYFDTPRDGAEPFAMLHCSH